ncbi:glycosyltransferase family 4 protein [Azoarcus sp. CIB]|uniref:glycosyltransferase family 4 protein n=1 Tax=Aromatoleum sp. (strain CIB) TaxID=198107 RepID=UPI00067DC175|nr:glycosyltransferase family 4 protein [Azoarcus sp. CIB]
MLGTSLQSPGGMTSVIRSLADAGFFSRYGVRYLASYEGGGLVRQVRVMSLIALQLVWMLMRGRVGLVHAHSASRGSFWRKSILCALSRLFSVPYVFHIHSGEFPVFFEAECGSTAKWWVRKTLREAATVVCLTPCWCDRIAAMDSRIRVEVIGNPVRVPDTLPAYDPNLTDVLFLGRLREKKGVFDLVDAVPAVIGECPRMRFVLAGDEGEAKIRTQSERLGVSAAIVLPGWVDGAHKDALLSNASIFVLPSYFEGLPVGVLEAMAHGVPVITTPVGGVPDVVCDGETGILIDAGDSMSLARALIQLGKDSSLRQRLRQRAYDFVKERYSIDVVMRQYSQTYERLGSQGVFFNPVR